jgi:hypothetical protein
VGDDGKRAAAAHLVEDFLGHGFLCKKFQAAFSDGLKGMGVGKQAKIRACATRPAID